MSLFEQPEFEWRETYFVLFDQAHLPTAEVLRAALESASSKFEIANVRTREDGTFESLTVYSPADLAAMDVTCIHGDDVTTQLPELIDELRPNCESEEEQQQLGQLVNSSARMDIYHFEQKDAGVVAAESSEEMEFMDPGGVLMVLELIGQLCEGVVVDPQTSTIM